MNALHQNRFSSHQMQHHLWEFFRSSRTVEAINKQTQRQMKLRQAYMQANQSADAEGYGDPEDEDEPVAAGDDDDDSWSVSNADSSEDEDEHEDAIGQLKTVLEFQMLGSLLASTDMSNHPVDTFMATLRHCAKCHTVASLLTETSGAVLQAIGVSAGELTFKPYLDHMVPRSTAHGVTPTIGERITALCAINVNGVAIARKAAGAEACADIKDELEVARYCNTCPLWLDQAGNELWPKVLGHETMLKPADCWKVEDRGDDGKRCRGVFLTDQEAALHFPHVPDVSELAGQAPLRSEDSLRLDNWTMPSCHAGDFDPIMTHTPILTFLLHDLQSIFQNLQQPMQRRLAALFYWNVLCANAANPDILLAVGAPDTDATRAARGHVCNFHAPSWMQCLETRLPFLEPGKHFGTIATTDSIPLSFEDFNTKQLHTQSKRAQAYLFWAFMEVHRACFRHVVHESTVIHIDGSSSVKLLTAAFELGILSNSPTRDEIQRALSNTKDAKKHTLHPISRARFLFWGYGRTKDSHAAQEAHAKSDTFNRLHSVAWAMESVWHSGTLVTGGFQTPHAPGGSAWGKSPIPSDVQDDRQRVYLERLARIQEYLTSGLSIEALEQQGKIRPIFPEWVREQRLMASDFVSLTSLAYTFTAPTASLQGGLGSSKVMMYHVCGADSRARAPPYPVTVARQCALPLTDLKFFRPPPPRLWKGNGQMAWAANVFEANELVKWWHTARVPAALWTLLTSTPTTSPIAKTRRAGACTRQVTCTNRDIRDFMEDDRSTDTDSDGEAR